MNILLLQTSIAWQQPQLNRENAERLIMSAPASDLVILPEMFTTGFCVDPEECFEPGNGDTLLWMKEVARSKNAALAGSIIVSEDKRYYNRLYFVKPGGEVLKYDKRHLFSPGDEQKIFSSGSERVIVEWRGIRILLQICYDIRFPVFSRNKDDYDLIIYVANWPASRIEAWNILARARAIENQCFVAAVNRTGIDPKAEYNGHTALIDYRGRDIVSTYENMEDAILGVIDMASLNDFRNKFPVSKDADRFSLIL